MTEPEELAPAKHAAGDAQKPNERDDVDAEIVRDLEVDQSSDDVRGGACPTSKPV